MKRVLVAMSGGVDSAVAAAILKNEGYSVTGITLIVTKETFDVIADAQAVCHHLNIAHRILDVSNAFNKSVLEPFVQGYLNGETPNPCGLCNPAIKFGVLYDYMLKEGFDYLATGHYARIVSDGSQSRLFRSPADRKDQGYFLHSLRPDQLKGLLLPLGDFESKDVTRELAVKFGIPIAKKKDSDGICFVKGKDYRHWLLEYLRETKSTDAAPEYSLVDAKGDIIGQLPFGLGVTIGQKRNLGIQLDADQCVVAISPMKRQVVIGHESQIYHRNLRAQAVNWIEADVEARLMNNALSLEAKIFNWGYVYSVEVSSLGDDGYRVDFFDPVRGIVAGQYVVFYRGDQILGGGIIKEVLS